VPQFRRLDAVFSSRAFGFAAKSVRARPVVNTAVLAHVCVRVRFSPFSIIFPLPHIHSCIIGGTKIEPVNGRSYIGTRSHPITTMTRHKLTNSVKQRTKLAEFTQDTPRPLWTGRFTTEFTKLDPIIADMNPVHIIITYVFYNHLRFTLNLSSTPSSSKQSVPFRFSDCSFYTFPASSVCFTCPTRVFLLNLIILTTFSKQIYCHNNLK
jgi:hypothetical protein